MKMNKVGGFGALARSPPPQRFYLFLAVSRLVDEVAGVGGVTLFTV